MKWIVRLLSAVALAAMSGCGTVQEVYHPQVIGPLPSAQACNGLSLQLMAPANLVQLGNPAAFSVAVRNTSDHGIWVPKKPQQGFFWTYPNGRHDCYMIDREETRFFHKAECLLIKPGGELLLAGLVDTSYFSRAGITEFLAEINVARNTNPELTPFWSGRLLSNAYGLQLVTFKNVSGAR